MSCLFCGTSLPGEALFCLTCGQLTPKGRGESRKSEQTPTIASVPSPADPYSLRPFTSYGPPSPEGGMHNFYAPPNPYVPLAPPPPPPPPPRHRRFFPGFPRGLFSGMLVLLLLSGGLGGWLLLKHGALSPLGPHAVRPAAAPQPAVQSANGPMVASQPTVQSTTPAANIPSTSLPGMWTLCAVENEMCTFSGTMTVAFGANGSFHYATKSNGTACTEAIFGDPLYGTHKACYREAAPPTTSVWTLCAAETATCSFLGTMTVAFGAKGSYKYATKINGVACTTVAFGDPLYGTVKSCYLIAPPTSAATWHKCAVESSTCSFTGKREVAYGANGVYFYGSFTNGVACTNSVFGDPASNAVKTCYNQQ
jgi:hypothetical protein